MNVPEVPTTHALNTAPVTPMLRTVLLCDIVESTALVERLGDMRAVALLKRHDQLLRQLMDLCHGQLVDKADGVLALFERPIQALDFALRYQRGLRELGALEALDLKARIGLHVGDVMTWANEPKDVLAGAKAFEVEGLAKPVAARLMNLALPGQILMSGMAQNLCHRAVGELGEAGNKLRWLMHGRYNFKGVPAPMLVHEVGEPGLSPLRAPESGAKAWRELPVWRRPPMVALEVLMVGVVGLALFWSALRSPPAIAFAERDWVVVADLQNRTGEKIFDQSLDTALRVGLEQSRHVNLISELQIDRALERMQRQGQPVDRQLAAELALREGAKAVILPTIAEVGGAVRISLEVVDPNSGVTVYSESADGSGTDNVLPALDIALAKVRGRLGEAVGSIEKTSMPLELVTTGNLDALRAYSLGLRARYESRLGEAQLLFKQAVKLDDQFSMAYLQLAFMRYIDNDAAATRRYLELAEANRTHLSQREALFLDGAAATLDSPATALERFTLLANIYPDEFRAHSNFAYFAHHDMLRSAEALAMIGPALATQNPRRGTAQYLAGLLNLALNRYAQAQEHFELAQSLGVSGFKRDHIETFVAQRRYGEAEREMATQRASGSVASDIEARLIEVSLPLDRGQYGKALAASRALEQATQAPEVTDLHRWNQAGITLTLRSLAPDATFAADLRAHADAQAVRLKDADSLLRRHVVFQALAAGWMAANSGNADLARRMLALVRDDPLVAAYPANAAMRRSVEAEIALASGDAQGAMAALPMKVDGPDGSYFERAVLMRAQAAAGQWAEAAATADWLARNRGRAFAESSSLGHWQAMNVAESSLALRAGADHRRQRGQVAEADQALVAFKAAWPDADRLAPVQHRFSKR
ncbi:MAG: putative peptide modification system cyclase [Lysobacteraceae bacterium]|nr:MAG: putative peptide modification system cyclase [Xanthomonadaceae bacterium]